MFAPTGIPGTVGGPPPVDRPTPRPYTSRPPERAVSSAVEHCFHTAGVSGSIPLPPTIRGSGLCLIGRSSGPQHAAGWRQARQRRHRAGVAQLVEQRIRNAWVGSSSLFTGTNSQSGDAAAVIEVRAGLRGAGTTVGCAMTRCVAKRGRGRRADDRPKARGRCVPQSPSRWRRSRRPRATPAGYPGSSGLPPLWAAVRVAPRHPLR
jgi:hypothetical protein